MISANMMSIQEIQTLIASKVRDRRLELNLSLKTLSEKSGVSYGSLKRFGQTGQISLESLLKLAIVLGKVDDFEPLFSPSPTSGIFSLDQLMETNKPRKRGRQ